MAAGECGPNVPGDTNKASLPNLMGRAKPKPKRPVPKTPRVPKHGPNRVWGHNG